MRAKKYKKFIDIAGALALGLALFSIPLTSSATSLSELQRQQTIKQQQAAAAAAAAAQAQKQADSINVQISNLDQQINATERALNETEGQMADTQSLIDDLSTKIKLQQDKLDFEKAKLDKVLVSWYMEGDDASLTYALLSSGTLSDLVTKQEYYDSIKQQIKEETEKVQAMKADLLDQKSSQDQKMIELTKLREQKQSYYNTTQAQLNSKNRLLNGTLAQKQDYLDQASKLQAEVHNLSDAIYTLRQQLGQGEIISDQGCGGYPYCNSTPDIPDPWMFLTRECTSYAAWYFNVMEGKSWHNTRPGSGSAYNWPALASDQGYSVSGTPRVGAIISWGTSSSMPYGHVAIVQGINGNGTIDVSEYNWVRFKYSYRENVSPSRYGSFSYIY